MLAPAASTRAAVPGLSSSTLHTTRRRYRLVRREVLTLLPFAHRAVVCAIVNGAGPGEPPAVPRLLTCLQQAQAVVQGVTQGSAVVHAALERGHRLGQAAGQRGGGGRVRAAGRRARLEPAVDAVHAGAALAGQAEVRGGGGRAD